MKIVKLDKKAERELKKLFQKDKEMYFRIKEELIGLAPNPFKGKPLAGDKKGCYRIRIGNYRAIYEIAGDEIWVIKIGHRREVYR